uniref:START domain-containing protein 10 n=1 Tax=Strigops habroptila TaxID=2489341 RepID=A0A672ULV2_STRHB
SELPAAAIATTGRSPMSKGGEMVYIPDDSDFSSFRDQCESLEGWHCRYNKAGVTVWSQGQEESCTVQKIKTRISCKDVPAETLYDVLHDTDYRKKWDSNMIETYDIGRLTVNADHRACPLKNRDFVTLRSWLPLGNDYMIINYSVKHPKYPPRKDFVRAVSLQTGYLIKANGTGACILYYLTQVDPHQGGSIPSGDLGHCGGLVPLCPQAMKKIYKAGLKYPEWKRKHDPGYKPWVYPEQNTLPSVSLAELSVQHADSLENIDETGLPEDHLSTSDHEA